MTNAAENRQRAKYYRLPEVRPARLDLAVELLVLMLIAVTSRGAPPAKDGSSCAEVTIPVAFSGRIGLVRVWVNRSPETFVIDTGSDTVINSDRLHLLVLHRLTASTTTTSGSALVDWDLVGIEEFSVGGRPIRTRATLAKSLAEIEEALGQEVDGILGNDVLNQWDSVTLDYKNRRLVLNCER